MGECLEDFDSPSIDVLNMGTIQTYELPLPKIGPALSIEQGRPLFRDFPFQLEYDFSLTLLNDDGRRGLRGDRRHRGLQAGESIIIKSSTARSLERSTVGLPRAQTKRVYRYGEFFNRFDSILPTTPY